MRKISPSINRSLLWAAKNGIDNIYTKDALSELDKKRNKCPVRTGHIIKERHLKLINQLPEGIYTNISQVKDIIERSIKRTDKDSLTYSPLVAKFNEFDCCKLMKYNRGNIITGRDKEIENILLVLCRKNKRGSILVGFPGTGKSAIVNAINARLIERNVPRQLIGCQIFNLDIPYVFTKNKQDPIGTIINVLERASTYDKAILFIDEVHQLLGQKMNDIMKPYLTEKIRFIGSTTINEYHTIITEDTALERRFTLINVSEPNIEETINMVKNTKSVFEEHHKCIIPDNICDYIVKNGSRFLGHRKNPDKSLDILDISCSIMYEKEIARKSDEFIETGEFINDIEKNASIIKSTKTVALNRNLNENHVNLAISSVTGIPYGEIKNSLDYKSVKKRIQSKIIGQEDAIESISNVVNIYKAIKSDRERPISIVLMIGPPGVGKKSTAELLSKNLFGRDDCFINYDMSSFKDGFAITELKGSPPGYVGYGKSGGLIKKVRNTPQSVIYFRGIDKANESIQQYLIDSCRSGKLVDSADREAKLNNAIVIFSITLSKEQQEKLNETKKEMGFTKKKEEKKEDNDYSKLEKMFGNSLINSVDNIIKFNELKEDDLEKIFNNNKQDYLKMYNIAIDQENLKKAVLENSKNGHDVISKLSAEIPRRVFQKMKEKR